MKNLTKEELIKKLVDTRAKLVNQYYTDHLTRLPNIYQLRLDMENETDFTFIVYNIDNFKILNDFYGFIVGDFILESVAKRLQMYFKDTPFYRIASDEFGILIPERMSFYELKSTLNELTMDLSHMRFEYSNTQIDIDATMASSSSSSYTNLFSKVSMALKYAKQEYQKFWIYEENTQTKDNYGDNLKLSRKFRDVLETKGVIPYFQPIIDLKTNKIVKFEALSRLIDKDGIIYAPISFLPITKTIKIYDKVTKDIIIKTFDIFSQNDFDFTINLSFEDIINPDIYQFIIEILIKTKMGHRVTFELLESENVTNFNKVHDFFNEIKRYNASVAIDDFGSGFSNFSQVIKLKPDYIKIDGSLIQNIDTDENARIVVETIVNFSKKLGIKTIAEFVHTSTILSTVKAIGVDYAQGYFIDKPKPEIG